MLKSDNDVFASTMCHSDFKSGQYPISRQILKDLSKHHSYKFFLKYVAFAVCLLREYKQVCHIQKMSDIKYFTPSNEAFVLTMLDNYWNHWMHEIQGLSTDENDDVNGDAPKPKYTSKSNKDKKKGSTKRFCGWSDDGEFFVVIIF